MRVCIAGNDQKDYGFTMKNALLLVDVQNDFMPGGPLGVPEGDAILPVINDSIGEYDLIAATQDWHPPSHGSFAQNHPDYKPFDKIELNGLEQTLWPVHCVWNTRGAAFADDLDCPRIAAIFRKGMDAGVDSYSGFFDNGRQHNTGLAEWLRAMNVQTLDIAGLAAEVCVADTARDAAELGFETSILEQGTRPLDEKAFSQVKQDLREQGVHFK